MRRYTAATSFEPSEVREGRRRGRSSSFRRKVGDSVHAGSTRSKENSATFFDVSVYGAPAESVGRYTRKGSRVAIDGRLEWREWETAEQHKRQAVSVVADTVQFLDSPAGSGEHGAADVGPDGEQGEGDLIGVGSGGEDLAF